jgi:hypothetical protein
MARFFDGNAEVDVASKEAGGLYDDFSFAADSTSLAWSKMRLVSEDQCRAAFDRTDEFESGELTVEQTKAVLLELLGDADVVTDTLPAFKEAADFNDGALSWEIFWECTADYLERAAAILEEEDAIRDGGVQWLRPHEMAVLEEPFLFGDASCTIIPGHLGDSYFLGAMACVAAHPDGIIENLFDEAADDFLESGQITVSFFRGSDWVDVVIDTRIPCDATGRPLYASASNPAEMWVAFVEKAYAKLHGGYGAIAVRGNAGEGSDKVKDTLVELCGGVGNRVLLGEPRAREMIEDGNPSELWKRVCSWLSRGYVVGCSRVPSKPSSGGAGGGEVSGDDSDSFSGDDASAMSGDSDDEDARPSTAAAAAESDGLADEKVYTVLRANEVGGLLFLHVRNPWGEGAMWKGEWSAESDAWDENPHIVSAMEADPNVKLTRPGDGGDGAAASDGTFWIVWQDFVSAFNVIDICSIFGPGFHQYIAKGEWRGKSASGMYRTVGSAAALEEVLARPKPATAVVPPMQHYNGDAAWCNNPQFRITPATASTVLISLMQLAPRGGFLHHTNFVVIKRARTDTARCWQLDHRAVVADATSAEFAEEGAAREVSRAGIELDPAFSYIVVPHTHARGAEAQFVLRVFSQQALTVAPLPETFSRELSGEWADRGQGSYVGDSCGGPLHKSVGTFAHPKFKLNPKWTQNPQFWLRCVDFAALAEAGSTTATFQIVLTRVGEGAEGEGGGASAPSEASSRDGTPRGTPDQSPTASPVPGAGTPRNKGGKAKSKRFPDNLSLVVCKPVISAGATAHRRAHAATLSATGKSGRRGGGGALPGSPRGGRSRRSPRKGATKEGGILDLAAAEAALPAVTLSIERKREVSTVEWSLQTMFESGRCSTVTVGPLSTDFLRDGLLITPCFSKVECEAPFTVAVHSDVPIAIAGLPPAQMQTLAGEWTEKTAMGSHLQKEWTKNPKYALQISDGRSRVGDVVRVNIALHRPLMLWRQRGTASVHCMVGFYVVVQKIAAKVPRIVGELHTPPPPGEAASGGHGRSSSASKAGDEGSLPFQTRFVPMNEVSTPVDFTLTVLPPDEHYVIVPCTFEAGHEGPFFLSVTCPDCAFIFEPKGKQAGGKKAKAPQASPRGKKASPRHGSFAPIASPSSKR